MAKLFNRAKMTTSTTGSGTVTLDSASVGYQSFADAGVANGDVVQYVIEEGGNFEIGTGTYSATGTSLTRSPTESSNSNAAISLSGAATVSITAVADDLNRLQHEGSTKVEPSATGATVTGNLAVTGTVDGRDVAADGTKLDGIESGATADQTAAEILTAIKTVDGSGSGLDADTLDGSHASAFLTGNQTITLTGDASGSGTTSINVTVANDSHTHDGRYYTETEADSRFVNATGDTMTGQLVVDDGNANPLELKRSSQVGIEFNDTSVGSRYLGVSGGNLWFGSNLNHGINQKVFTDAYHPNADKWTTARTLSLTGAVTGSVSWDGSGNASLSTSYNDNGPNWVDAATGQYGTVKVDDDRGVTWAGWAIRDDWVFMSNGAAEAGIYNDTDNDWAIKFAQNGSTSLQYDGSTRFQTESAGASAPNGLRVGNTGNPHNADALEINTATDEKIVLSGSTNPYIRWQEGTTDRAYIYWNAAQDAFMFRNSQSDYFDFIPHDATGAVNIRLRGSDNDTWGSVYADDNGNAAGRIGFLDDDQSWAYRITSDASHEWMINGAIPLNLTSSTLTLDGGTSSTLSVKCDDSGLALIRAAGDNQGTGAIEVGQSPQYGGGISYNGDGSPAFVGGEVADRVTFYRLNAGTRTEVFSYSYDSSNVEFNGSIYTPSVLTTGNWLDAANGMRHVGDTDTSVTFNTNEISLTTGGSTKAIVNSTGVRLGDSGNGYFQPVSGNYGSVQIDGGAHGGYEGYSIGARAVFMHNNSTATGIFNDVENEWLFLGQHNGYTRMYYNGSSKLETTSTGVTVTGDLNSTSDIRYKKNIETIDNALEKVQSLRGVTYNWDNDAFKEDEDTKRPNFTERATGVIAQDVEKVLPEAVRENEDGFKNVAYGNMVGLLIEAIKEQQEQIDELKKQLNG